MVDEASEFVDWRFEILNRELSGKTIQITCTEPILHALFFLNAAAPFENSQAALEHVAKFYWLLLERASHIFSETEWRTLSGLLSPFAGGEFFGKSASEAVNKIESDYPGREWGAGILAVKDLLPKVAALSDAEFAAMNEILFLVCNLYSDDPWFTLSRKLPALTVVSESCGAGGLR